MREILGKLHDVLTKIWAFLVVSRVEFMVMGIPVIAISALLAASRPDDLMGDGAVRLGLLTAVWYLAYWISSQVNCIADYELDKSEVLRVACIQEVYEEWSVRGAKILTPPVDRGVEIRCYIRDPDGHLMRSYPRRGAAPAKNFGPRRLR